MPRSHFTPSALNPGGIGQFNDAAYGDPLLTFVGCVVGSHALVISRNGLDLMCRLLRQGCAATAILRPGEHCDHEAFDLVLVPDVGSVDVMGRLVRQAKRALVPGGRFLAVASVDLLGTDSAAVEDLQQSIESNGFVDFRTRRFTGGLLMQAALPKDVRITSMPSWLQVQA